jgi:hypothetical protein
MQIANLNWQMTQKGQTMLLTVMILSSAILSATALAGLLVRYQLRQSSDIKLSTQAIFAADSGIECYLYEREKGTQNYTNCGEGGEISLGNGAVYTVVIGANNVKSVGKSGGAARAFELTF